MVMQSKFQLLSTLKWKPRIVIILLPELTPCTAQSHPCNNNGNCTANVDESVECHCFEGWEGETCQIGEFDWYTIGLL